jgi:hypothetical protein
MMRALRRRTICLPLAAAEAAAASSASVDEAFVLAPLANVSRLEGDDNDDKEEEGNDDKGGGDGGSGKKKKKIMCPWRRWDEMNEQLETDIEASIEFAKWNVAKSLMQEILKCPQVCISADYHICFIRNGIDGKQFSIIDFLKLATRRDGPKEGTARGSNNKFTAAFVPLLAVLLANNAPISHILNKYLLHLALKHRI